ncbi:dienoyl reductase peroxisomal family protein [Cystoisospora suis]|uniref:2,4-dienoyl-CoA reductase [(3E)-enoyl-CoA-producing] n=1 Tax=Cystoisospora suis TaxID=483139 RepID=A0A2C6KGG2_9APIC|nr:dienoyl reductase peroxisomal family protein [Cystoisospora suis]
MESSQSSFRRDCLAGKVAFITGGGSGICKEIAKQFLLHGADVVIASRNIQRLRDTAEVLSAATGGRCFPVAMDVRNETQVAAAVDLGLKKFGKIDILVNGAAGNFPCAAEKLSYKGFKTVMEIDAHGAFIVSKTVFDKCFKPDMHHLLTQRERSQAGPNTEKPKMDACQYGKVILNISMTLHYAGALLQTHAGAAKAAVDAMTKHLAVEWGPYNIRVNCIAPGPIQGTLGLQKLNPFANTAVTDSSAREEQGSGGQRRQAPQEGQISPRTAQPVEADLLVRFIPLQRYGTSQDVAHAAIFLCLPEASYVTGSTLVVDGGQWMASGNYPLLEPRQNAAWRRAPYKMAESRL